jgi:hypothetical protein
MGSVVTSGMVTGGGSTLRLLLQNGVFKFTQGDELIAIHVPERFSDLSMTMFFVEATI